MLVQTIFMIVKEDFFANDEEELRERVEFSLFLALSLSRFLSFEFSHCE